MGHQGVRKYELEIKLDPTIKLAQLAAPDDTDHDAETARAMGVRCILYAGGHQTRPRLEATGCTVIDRLADLPSLL